MSAAAAFTAALAAHRSVAARAFHIHRTTPVPPPTPYVRSLFPGLSVYLEHAARRYIAFKAHCISNPSPQSSPLVSRALGTGSPIHNPIFKVRRERWLQWLGEKAHRARLPMFPTLSTLSHILPLICGIPSDVRARYAKLHRAHLTKMAVRPRPCVLKPPRRLGNITHHDQNIIVHVALHEHVARCRASLANGHAMLTTGVQMPLDTFDQVRARYAGTPDPLYRRKSSRKFAAHRRRRREMAAAAARRVTDAEAGMHARRGHDQVLSGRKAGDTSFAPFLYELDNGAYVYSSRITEAPKLRGKMIDKYSTPAKCVGVDSWQKAQVAAETNPLFHTRVMNRFG